MREREKEVKGRKGEKERRKKGERKKVKKLIIIF